MNELGKMNSEGTKNATEPQEKTMISRQSQMLVITHDCLNAVERIMSEAYVSEVKSAELKEPCNFTEAQDLNIMLGYRLRELLYDFEKHFKG